MEASVSWWVIFHLFIGLILALDLGVLSKENKPVSFKKSLGWTFVWVMIAFCFNIIIYQQFGSGPAKEFLTAYVLEKSLSIDNIFIMTVIFSHFKIQSKFQHRVLFWGILGAIIMRMGLILGGVALIHRFHFILYFFGAFLVFTGIKMLFSKEHEVDPEEKFLMKWFRRHFRLAEGGSDEPMFIKKINQKWHITPLLMCLILIELTDLVFAFDSIPATLSVTHHSFIAYSSNIFAILGLRSLYFAFAGVVGLFRFLSIALSFILIFIGAKMLLENWIVIDNSVSLLVVILLITLSIIFSLIFPKKKELI